MTQTLGRTDGPDSPRRRITLLPLTVLLRGLNYCTTLCTNTALDLPDRGALNVRNTDNISIPHLLDCLTDQTPRDLVLIPRLLSLLIDTTRRRTFGPQALHFTTINKTQITRSLLHHTRHINLTICRNCNLSRYTSIIYLGHPNTRHPNDINQPLPRIRVQLTSSNRILVGNSALLNCLNRPSCTRR